MTVVPAHTEAADAAMETLTGNNGFTVMVTVLDVAGFPVAHDELEVTTQATVFPFDGTNP